MPDSNLQRLRDLSRALFGGAMYRAEIGAAIADADPPICAKDLVEALGGAVDKATVSNEVKILKAAGILSSVRSEPGDRRKFLAPDVESAYWRLCQQLRQAASA